MVSQEPGRIDRARAYVSGDIQIEGDVFAGLDEIARAAVSMGKTKPSGEPDVDAWLNIILRAEA